MLGRPKGFKKETLKKYKYVKYLYSQNNTSINEACKLAKISKTTFYRIDNSIEKQNTEEKYK